VLHLEIAAQEMARFLERRCLHDGSPSEATIPSYHCRSRKALPRATSESTPGRGRDVSSSNSL
jgi:hypothetical protein